MRRKRNKISEQTRPAPTRLDQRGQSLLLVAGGLVFFLLIIGLAIDVGLLFVERIRLGRACDAAALAETTMVQLRRLAQDLRPPALDTAGLHPALEGLCRVFAAYTRLAITYSGRDLPAMPEEMQICLYRFLQEALTNVAKHAQASCVDIRLKDNDGMIVLEVQDDGLGFDPQQEYHGHMGLHSMRERAVKAGSTLGIESVPGHGTLIRISILPSESG